jgi:hypothetical protein
MLDRTGGEEMSPAAIPLTRLGGREMESDLGSKTFLPVTRFISDWMHWAGSDSQRREGAVAEADLAARFVSSSSGMSHIYIHWS